MKQYSRETSTAHSEAMALLKNRVKSTMEDSIMSSDVFAKEWEPYIRDIALTKEANGKKYYRSQEYASIGVMDRNDLIQEAYLAFLNAYSQVDWKRIEKSNNPEAELWAYLKKRTVLDTNMAIRNNKDGMRITQYGLFQSKEAQDTNVKMITSLFNHLELAFANNVEEVAVTKYETDLLGYFLESHMDDFLDLNFKGERNRTGIERIVMLSYYGIDNVRKTAKEIAETFKVSESTIKNVVKRAQKKLRCDESREIISNFCKEYFINTQADIN